MSILVNKDSRIITQGITVKQVYFTLNNVVIMEQKWWEV